MGLSVGELFVDLGIKGESKTMGALTGVHRGMSDLGAVSIETKAAILAAFYALEQLTAASFNLGTSMQNLGAFTGQPALMKTVQQWQYAGSQAQVGAEEISGAFKSVQSTMTKVLAGEGSPKWLGLISNATKLDPTRIRDTAYVMNQLTLAAQKLPADLGNQALKSFGLSDNIIAGMRRGKFNPIELAKAPTISDKELGSLDRANAAWARLGKTVELAFAHFNAKHGGQLVEDLTVIVHATEKLADALVKLSEKAGVFGGIARGVKELAGAMNDISGWLDGKRTFWGEDIGKDGKLRQTENMDKPGEGRSLTGATLGNFFDTVKLLATTKSRDNGVPDYLKQIQAIKPVFDLSRAGPLGPIAPTVPPQVAVTQTFVYQGDGHDSKRQAHDADKHIKKTFRELPQGQAN